MTRIANQHWRSMLLRTGFALFLFGFAPLVIYCEVAELTQDPKYTEDNLGLGLLTAVVGWPGLLMMLIGVSLDRGAPSRRRASNEN